jgi:hypothetical protein
MGIVRQPYHKLNMGDAKAPTGRANEASADKHLLPRRQSITSTTYLVLR